MNYSPSSIYLDYPEDTVSTLGHSLQSGLQSRGEAHPIPIYFRADDIGVLSKSFETLLALFSRFNIPLCLAVVPAWLTPTRWSGINQICDTGNVIWCWHQHGWQHTNHQKSGKKCEFGADRPSSAIAEDLGRGKSRLLEIMGPCFSPFFTPPWNRCSDETLLLIRNAGFKAISTDRSKSSSHHTIIPDIPVNVDLHTRRETDPMSCLQAIASELESAARIGGIGIMIHHQKMNKNGFLLLHGLLELVVNNPDLIPVRFNDLV